MIARIAALLLALAVAVHAAEWDKLEGCRLVADEYGDGDSFHVRQGDKDFIFRLYFVDTPETDIRFPERVATQAQYFSITPAQALELGERAAEFTRSALRNPFTVWTKWQDARGASKQHRFYAIVITPTGDLALGLVNTGLARIYGMKAKMLPNGMDEKLYLSTLQQIEAVAKKRKLGGWGL
jgi:endonuclease YncB( thermonuclease family)